MLQRRTDMTTIGNIIALHTLDDGRTKHTRQDWVLTKGLLHSSPTWISCNVENRSIANQTSLRT